MKEVWLLKMKTKSISESKSTQSLSSKSSNEFKHIEPSNYTAFNGVVILTLALIIVKILSAIYRVPYQNVLEILGCAYQQIYPIVALGMILSECYSKCGNANAGY